ncbi:MAG: branched-chain amino acid aminotransferase [Dissulfurimicrobium sp.]|uniref:branched-chain amino acid aminotransferase n=1 Tax=Dissulfurimicrobium TaxID=1769732 RepID=UPI001EDC8838|nr:branched-chain amino acid aminotransferase [Dissulfurimicrobium hydrothermale]UKL14017.1 branched-chain amino acid aminotransferase [Dissulfurimicrobium hydrothermale]
MDIKTLLLDDSRRKRLPPQDNLKFGVYFTDHMFLMDYEEELSWHNPRVVPYGNFSMDPASVCFHYGQEIFEGLKAYRCSDGKIRLFRPRDNVKRLNRSAWRMCMPQVDEDLAVTAIKQLVKIDERWVPSARGTSLYIRPFMIATEAFLGVRPSKKYLFAVILSPVGAYYSEGFNPVKIFVTDKYARAVRGGVGESKNAGNYAASLMASEEAKKLGFTQVLWLDAVERRYVEEVGTMNIFFLFEDVLATPALSGSILPGITRDSVIRIAKTQGLKVEERAIPIDEVIEKAKDGRLKECFGTGTAAVISPVGSLFYKGESYRINGGNTGPYAQALFDEITGIQYGELEDRYGWVEIL